MPTLNDTAVPNESGAQQHPSHPTKPAATRHPASKPGHTGSLTARHTTPTRPHNLPKNTNHLAGHVVRQVLLALSEPPNDLAALAAALPTQAAVNAASNSLQRQAMVAVAGFKTGLAVAANLSIAIGIDQ